MARPRTFRHNVWLRLPPIENALVGFYGQVYGKDQTGVIRGMIKNYVRADENFDAKKFKRYIEQTALPGAGDDEEYKAELKEQMAAFLTTVRSASR